MSNTVLVKVDELPSSFLEINPHNLYLYCKSYTASIRANSAQAKNRSMVSGGGKNHGRKKVAVEQEQVQLPLLCL
jgi:large subunit ribosomal protein L4